MAYLLKQRGFKNIQILEASNRIGGKSRTINYRGANHEMGTCYLSADYEHNILRLVNQFTQSATKPPPIASVWSRLTPNSSVTFNHYYSMVLKMKYPNLNMMEIQGLFLRKLKTYVYLHKTMFGDYYGEIMPQPSPQIMEKIKGTFLDFLERNGLADLEEMFTASHTLQGYGRISEIPALYGLMWNTPKVIGSLVELVKGKAGAIYMLEDGFENLWRTIAEKNHLNVMFKSKVRHVMLSGRHGNEKAYIYYINNGRLRYRKFDFLIWTPPVNTLMRILSGVGLQEERKLFRGMTNSYYATSLVDDVGGRRGQSSVNWWMENIKGGKDFSVWANRDAYTMFHDLNGMRYSQQQTVTGSDNQTEIRTSVFYQYSHNKPRKDHLASVLKRHLKKMGASSVEIIKQYPWKYFTRFTEPQLLSGAIWKVLELQGKRNMWFVGASVSFESVKSVVEYNQLLVDRMTEPNN
uniref:Amine oxidase domain-containing protein n=2 Tax=Clytia hemisphaerica TaxID=252671 RepID=A0A7M5UXT1_9CNID|eukprot:TCONS_00006604-protein